MNYGIISKSGQEIRCDLTCSRKEKQCSAAVTCCFSWCSLCVWWLFTPKKSTPALRGLACVCICSPEPSQLNWSLITATESVAKDCCLQLQLSPCTNIGQLSENETLVEWSLPRWLTRCRSHLPSSNNSSNIMVYHHRRQHLTPNRSPRINHRVGCLPCTSLHKTVPQTT